MEKKRWIDGWMDVRHEENNIEEELGKPNLYTPTLLRAKHTRPYDSLPDPQPRASNLLRHGYQSSKGPCGSKRQSHK